MTCCTASQRSRCSCNQRSGSSHQPLGILNTAGIGSVAGGTNGLAVTMDHLLDLKKEVTIDNADAPTAGYLTNAKVEAAVSKLKDGNGQYLLSPFGTELGRSQIAGGVLRSATTSPQTSQK